MHPLLIQSNRLYGSAGPLVVLMPSLGRGAVDFSRLGAALGAAGCRAIAVNPRGVGRTVSLPGPTTLHDYAADLGALIELRGDGPAHVLGHAFGNRVVRTLAADRPELVRSLVQLACGGQAEPEEDARAAFATCFNETLAWSDRRDAVRLCFFAPGNDPDAWEHGWHATAAAGERAAVAATPPRDYRHAGTAPILIVQGLQDRMAPPANGRILKEELGGRVTLIELEECGHAMLPEQPERIAAEVVAYLKTR